MQRAATRRSVSGRSQLSFPPVHGDNDRYPLPRSRMRHSVYLSSCIRPPVAVAVVAVITTLMYLSLTPCFSLIVSLLSLKFALFYIISSRTVERANYPLSRIPSSADLHLSHAAIFPYRLGVLVAHLDCLLHLSSPVLYCVTFRLISHLHVNKMHPYKKETLFSRHLHKMCLGTANK